jgi:hypothetical protein
MGETRIDISEFKSEGGETIKELSEFLKEKTKVEVETTSSEIVVKTEGKPVSGAYLRVLLRKFLHQHELKDYFRVIRGKGNTLMVKEKRILEEE